VRSSNSVNVASVHFSVTMVISGKQTTRLDGNVVEKTVTIENNNLVADDCDQLQMSLQHAVEKYATSTDEFSP
jgi:hypothetical protein